MMSCRSIACVALASLAGLLGACAQPQSSDWPGFRGAARDGRYTGPPIVTAWPREGPPPLWRREVGDAYGSMSIVGNRLFTMERHGQTEGAHAYDTATGELIWKDRHDSEFARILGNDGSLTTPTWNDGRLYTLGVTGEFRCLDADTGRVLWRRNIIEENGAKLPEYGVAASPLVVDGKVVVLAGGPNGRSVVAYDEVSGERVWSSLDDPQAYTAPMIATLDGVRQILVVSGTRVMGLQIADGALLWEYPWRTTELMLNVTQPLVVDGTKVVVASGYQMGGVMLDVKRRNGAFEVKKVWASGDLESKFNAPVLFGRHLYGFDEQHLVSIDLETGRATWRQRDTFGFGQLVLAGESLIVVSEWGDVALVDATPDGYRPRGAFQPLKERTYNVPAVAHGTLFVRSRREMKAFDLRPRELSGME